MESKKENTPINYYALLCPFIGVVCPTNYLYRQWCEDIGKQIWGEDARFRHLRAIDNVRGVEFYAVEKGYQYWKVDERVYDDAVRRVR